MPRTPDVLVHGAALGRPLTATRVRRTVRAVARGEGRPLTEASVTFLSSQRMRALNRRSFGRDRATDVIAFGMHHDAGLVADIYVCPAVARREARSRGLTLGEELQRLVVHGTLHAVGWDHPEGPERERSKMWERQEHYLRRLAGAR